MLFNSFSFLLIFLPAVLGLSLCLRGNAVLAFITLCSFVFYALFGQPWFLIPMVITIGLDYFMAIALASTEVQWQRRALLGISLLGNVGMLVCFKYGELLSALINDTLHFYGISGSLPWTSLRWVLPAGISFYTFQTLSYMIDVYRNETRPERNFWKFAGFVSFFPHLIAGPLTRHHQLLPQLEAIRQNGVRPRWADGVFLFAIGLSKKVLIADPLAGGVDTLLQQLPAYGTSGAWLAMVGFGLQIYFDFSGYCDMAIGLGRMFGVELPQNFNDPYRALNPSDFWQRWHITLSQWFRDYVYIPLGGSRLSLHRTFSNLLLTMLLAGMWHGTRWTYLIWGLYHGLLLAIYHFTKTHWDVYPPWIQRTFTFFLVCLGWIFFRSTSLFEAVGWLRQLAGLSGFKSAATLHLLQPMAPALIVGLILISGWPVASATSRLRRLEWPWQIALACCTWLAILLMNRSSQFLYFQF